jgi:hypothetical protein
MVDSVLAFVAVSAIVICTPGQDTALTIRNTLSGGGGAASQPQAESHWVRPSGRAQRAPAWSRS